MSDSPSIGQELTAELLDERLEGYRVLREVGRGAMGIVFEARQRGLERRVAVKVLPPQLSLRDRTVKRFLREAEAMGRLAHANIVDVYEVGSLGGLHFFAMRFIDGPPLDVVLKAGVLGIGDVIQVGLDVAGAMAHAHSRGVLHRDVKPSNLLRDGERVVLTDFGLAKPTDSDDEGAMTESGDLVGTPLYMSPEQILGDSGGIDGRSDVWALGVTLYELLIGRPPFSGTSAQSILHSILHKDPPLLRRQRADVPRDLEAVILKCLEKDPARRYSGAAGLQADLLAIQGGQSVSARPPRLADPLIRWSRRHPWQTAGLLVGLLGFAIFGKQLSTSRRDLKQTERDKSLAEGQREEARQDKGLALARAELLDATNEWSDARRHAHDPQAYARLRLHAFERVANLMFVMPFDQNPELAAEIMQVYARFSRESDSGDQALANFDLENGNSKSPMTLAMRAAMLEGLDRLEEALSVHQMRARLYPRSPESWLDGAKVLYRLALRDRASGDDPTARRRLARAVELCDQALTRAVRALNTNQAATVLIERARCLIELDQRGLAETALLQALANDSARVHARALLQACRQEAEAPETLASVPAKVADPAEPAASDAKVAAAEGDGGSPAGGPGSPGGQGARAERGKNAGKPLLPLDSLPLMGRVGDPLDLDRADLAQAGKNLTSIYRGLRDVLRTAAGAAPEPAEGGASGSDSGVHADPVQE
jgi:serine/threonine protein kinase